MWCALAGPVSSAKLSLRWDAQRPALGIRLSFMIADQNYGAHSAQVEMHAQHWAEVATELEQYLTSPLPSQPAVSVVAGQPPAGLTFSGGQEF
jgi:hypothetical protein